MGRLVSQVPNHDWDRRQRIFNDKYRRIGVDVQSLDRQTAAHEARTEQQVNESRAAAKLAEAFDQAMCLDAATARAQTIARDQQIQAYQLSQHCQDSTWDLNRPDRLKRQQPARLSDIDARCGPASIQKFEGEDLSIASRVLGQNAQCRAWWNAELEKKQQEKKAAELYDQSLASRAQYQDRTQAEAIAEETVARRAYNRACLLSNQDLAEKRRKAAEAQKESEAAASRTEQAFCETSPWLNEDRSGNVSCADPGRLRKDNYKGMSSTETRSIADDQKAQVQEKIERQKQAAANELSASRAQDTYTMSWKAQQSEAAQAKALAQRQQAEILRAQIQEKHNRDKRMKELYTNPPTSAYFAQFGTSHR